MGGAPIVVRTADGWTAAASVAAIVAATSTLVLAFFTWRLAKQTKEMASQTYREAEAVGAQIAVANEQARLSRATLDSQTRPWLTTVTRGEDVRPTGERYIRGEVHLVEEADGTIAGAIPLRNVGPGVALILAGESWVFGHQKVEKKLARYTTLRTPTPVVPSGDEATLRFRIPKSSASWIELTRSHFTGVAHGLDGDFSLEVRYSDWNGQQVTVAEVQIGREAPTEPWYVFRIDYRRADGEEIASVRFS